MRAARRLLILLLVALLLGIPSLSAKAVDDYTITISGLGADASRDMIVHYQNVGTADEFSHKILVLNRNDSTYSIRLKKIEAVKDSLLLDSLTFSFTDSCSGRELTVSKADVGKTDWPELYAAAKNSEGSFTLKTRVSQLTNEHQGLSCTVRFTFEIIQISNKPTSGESPQTGNDAGQAPDKPSQTGTGHRKSPQTGDGANPLLWCLVLLGAAIALGFLLMIWKRRKKTKNEGDIVSMTQQPEEAKRRKAKEPAGKKIKRIILDVLLAVAILAVVSAAVSAIFFNNEDTFLLGYKPYIVSSESMAPAYRKYAVVLVKNQTYDEVEPGELIAFRADELGGKPAFHRVVEITPDGFITKGDANKINDGQVVDREAFLGRRVWHTNLTADLIPLLMTPKGFIFIIVLPVLLIFLIIIFIKVLQIARKNNRKPARAHPRHLSRPDSGQVKDIDSDSEVHED